MLLALALAKMMEIYKQMYFQKLISHDATPAPFSISSVPPRGPRPPLWEQLLQGEVYMVIFWGPGSYHDLSQSVSHSEVKISFVYDVDEAALRLTPRRGDHGVVRLQHCDLCKKISIDWNIAIPTFTISYRLVLHYIVHFDIKMKRLHLHWTSEQEVQVDQEDQVDQEC